MRIYPKILLITLPLIIASVLVTGFVAHIISRQAIRDVVENSLAIRLDRAVALCGLQESPLPATRGSMISERTENCIRSINFGATGNVFIVDSGGQIVVHRNQKLQSMDVGSRNWFNEMAGSRSGGVEFVMAGKNHWGVYAFIEPWNWYLVCNGEEDDLAGPIAKLGETILLLALLCLILAAIPLFVLARRLTEPIHSLIKGTEQIRAGRLETHISITTADEIGVLAGAFNATTARLRKSIENLEERNLQLNKEIGERVRFQEELAKSEVKYRTIFDNAVEGIFRSLVDGRFLTVNPAFAAILGYDSPEEVMTSIDNIGRQVYVDAEDRQKFLQQVSSREVLTGFDSRIRRKDGSIGWITMSAKATRDETGAIRHIDGYCVDITAKKEAVEERKRLEEQLRQSQKMEAMGNLAGGIAHDFNNLLQAIIGYIELLLMKNRAEGDRTYLEQVHRASLRASDLVRRLLTFSRKVAFKPVKLDLNQVIGEILGMLERTIPKMTTIEQRLADDLEQIQADPTQMEQVLVNLVTNAVDAMNGRGVIIIQTENFKVDRDYRNKYLELKSEAYVRMSISDNGAGMDQETMQRIFEPFFTTKLPGKGTGLGLATVYGIVKGHRGHITCYSEVGQGTTFNLYFPLSLDVEIHEEKQEPKKGTSLAGNETILLVDDEKIILEIGYDILIQHGYKIFQAESGEEALRLLKEHTGAIDLVLMDLGMPGMGGEECLGELKKLEPALKVIVASGYSGHKIAAAPEKFGAAGFLHKPYRLDTLLTEVRTVLDG
jgi:PAS domain S-box-containing protein